MTAEEFRSELIAALDPRGGETEPLVCADEYWHTVLSIVWKGGIRFTVMLSLSRRGGGEYFVLRDGCIITPVYRFGSAEKAPVSRMQRLIDDIVSGKLRNKKTVAEQVKAVVEQRGLVSYMNDTKWRELFEALMERFPRNALKYKTLFDEEEPRGYWDIFSDEDIFRMKWSSIEYLKIRYILTEETHTGMLLPPNIKLYDVKDDILALFREYSIPFECDEGVEEFIVYGYK